MRGGASLTDSLSSHFLLPEPGRHGRTAGSARMRTCFQLPFHSLMRLEAGVVLGSALGAPLLH